MEEGSTGHLGSIQQRKPAWPVGIREIPLKWYLSWLGGYCSFINGCQGQRLALTAAQLMATGPLHSMELWAEHTPTVVKAAVPALGPEPGFSQYTCPEFTRSPPCPISEATSRELQTDVNVATSSWGSHCSTSPICPGSVFIFFYAQSHSPV